MSPLDEMLIETRRDWAGLSRPESKELRLRNARQRQRIQRLTGLLEKADLAIRPFAHEDLCKFTGGNVQGGDSPVFGRDKAILTLADFWRARDFLRRNV